MRPLGSLLTCFHGGIVSEDVWAPILDPGSLSEAFEARTNTTLDHPCKPNFTKPYNSHLLRFPKIVLITIIFLKKAFKNPFKRLLKGLKKLL